MFHSIYAFEYAATLLLRNWKEATSMETVQRTAFQDLHDSIDQVLTAEWEKMSTEPRLVHGKWVSVFSMTETNGMCARDALAQ